MRQLKRLKTLRLFSPDHSHSTGDLRLLDWQEIANEIFNVLFEPCPHFTGLVIDARETYGDCSRRTVERLGFLCARQADERGRTKAVGIPIEPHMIKHHEPFSDIFEDDFGPVEGPRWEQEWYSCRVHRCC